MRIICVDDEELVLQLTVSLCRELPEVEDVQGFSKAKDALKYLKTNPADIALLDIDMPDMNGILLAKKIKETNSNTAIVFLTGYSQYAVDAFNIRANGYLLKPISKSRLAEEIAYITKEKKERPSHIRIRTFGNFDLIVDGKTVHFGRSKAKELFAYLVDRQGYGVKRSEAFAILWEDRLYDRSMQKQLDVIIRSMKDTLNEYEIGEIFESKNGLMRIDTEKVDCDFYRFLQGDSDAINSYRGEYMNSYSWAEMTEAFMTNTFQKQ